MNKKTLVLTIFIIAFFISISGLSAASSIGSSTISVSSSSLTVPQGGTQSVGYTVTLSSGTSWGTEISAKAPSGISVSFSKASGDPTYSGTATISVSSSVSQGTYTVTFDATGDDPSTNSPAISVAVTAAQKVNGTSAITLSKTSVSLSGLNQTTVGYSVALHNGTSGATTLEYSGQGNLIVSFSTPSGSPPFSGTMTIKGTSSATSGTYDITVYATGTDPSMAKVTVDISYTASPSSSTSSITPYILGSIVIILGIIGLILAYTIFGNRAEKVRGGALAASSIISIYLILFDSTLRTVAPDHFYGLIAFLVLSIVGFVVAIRGKSLQKYANGALFSGSILFGILMVSDVFLGLPLSKSSGISAAIGWDYLFGFGITSASFLSVSLAFSLLFISVMTLAGSSLKILKK